MKYEAVVVGEMYIDHVFTGFSAWPQPGEEAAWMEANKTALGEVLAAA